MLTSLKRIIKSGWLNFSRNLGLSISTIFIMIMVILLVTFLFIFDIASKVLISDIQNKVDISVYFKKDTATENILDVKSEIAKIPEVKEVEYVSQEQALEEFVGRHKDDPLLLESLTEIGGNPFLSSLNIRAQQASQYQQISNFFDNYSKKDLIEKVDYYERKPVIDKIFSVTLSIKKGGVLFSIVLGLISILVALNTIRITICNSSEEIATMRLVGGSNRFIQGPFLIQGVIGGIFATVITFLITLGLCYGFDSGIKTIAPNISSFGLFLSNFWILFLIQLATGIGLGIISSFIAVRRYLRV